MRYGITNVRNVLILFLEVLYLSIHLTLISLSFHNIRHKILILTLSQVKI